MAKRKVDFGLTLPNRGVVVGRIRAREVVDLAVKAEETGVLTTVWAGDSILGRPRLECTTLLSAIAARTNRVRLGVACMSTLVQRHPVLVGVQWASLDALSEGRTQLVACMGQPASQGPSTAKELEVMGIASKERPGRLVEMVAALRELWSSEHATFHGKYYRFDDVNLLPKPVQQPCPIWIAATPQPQNLGERGVERVLRRIALNADGWQTILIKPEMFRDYLTRIRKIREAEGLDNAGFKTSLYYNLIVDPDKEAAFRESKAYHDEYYATDFPREVVELLTAHGSVEQCVASIQSYIDAGVDHITMRLATRDEKARQFDLYVNEVLPALGVRAA